MPINWTPEEIQFLQKNLHLPTADIFKAFQEARAWENIRTYDSVQKKVKALRELYVEVPTVTQDNHTALPLLEDTSLLVPTRTVQNEISEWLTNTSDNFAGRQSTPVDTNGLSLVIVLSDNHFGKKTEDFNLEIARERVVSITDQIIANRGGDTEYVDEVVLVLAGDEVEGEDIYSNQNGALECPVIYQAKAACEAYWQLALDLRATFQCRVRIVTCPGNHGRMSKTADTRSNWDNVVYMMLGVLVEQNPELDIQMDLNFDEFALFEVKGKLGCAYHYGTKHLGTPAMTQKMAGWVLSKGIDFLVHGHWHHWGIETYLGRPMMHNGCLCGPDDLAEKMAVEEPPRQGYFYVERDKPIRTFCFVEW